MPLCATILPGRSDEQPHGGPPLLSRISRLGLSTDFSADLDDEKGHDSVAREHTDRLCSTKDIHTRLPWVPGRIAHSLAGKEV